MITIEEIVQSLAEVELSTSIVGLKADVPLMKQGLDSLDMATALLALESKYEKPISPEDAARLRTLTDIAAYLNA